MPKKLLLIASLLFNLASIIPAQAQPTRLNFYSKGRVNQLLQAADINLILEQENVVLDFFATWCQPCKAISDAIESLAKESPQVLVVKINTGLFNEVSSKYGIRGIPAVLFIKSGRVVKQLVGAQSKEVYTAAAHEAFGK